ncbi:MAG: peptide chain release factor N(5)-glutamine methyltransferase [Treponema sp.]|jgi:release factor glutamine methyltransferase|nr:peptide chain release factor N(5)-glutamine methyltransferase [Treponema sp.]
MTICEALVQGSAVLKNAGIDTSSLDASVLLANILNINRSSLIAKGKEILTEEKLSIFDLFIDRRKKGECIAYITGNKEFFGLNFTVNPTVLVPRPDTEILVEASLEQIKTLNMANGTTDKIRVLDLCTGSGAVAISIKHEMPETEVWAADLSEQALETARENSDRLLGAGSVNFFHGDLFNALPSENPSFSLIVSNPPYVPTDEIQTLSAEVQNEPFIALDGGKSGLEIIERIINKSPDYIKQEGFLFLEASPHQMKNIFPLLVNRGFKDIKLYKDLSRQDRVIGGRYE